MSTFTKEPFSFGSNNFEPFDISANATGFAPASLHAAANYPSVDEVWLWVQMEQYWSGVVTVYSQIYDSTGVNPISAPRYYCRNVPFQGGFPVLILPGIPISNANPSEMNKLMIMDDYGSFVTVQAFGYVNRITA